MNKQRCAPPALLLSNTLVDPDFFQIVFLIDAYMFVIVRYVCIDIDCKLLRICWQARGCRNRTEVQVKVFDLASPIAAQTNLRAGTERPAGLCRVTSELGADGVDAGGDEGDVDGDVDRGVDGNLDRFIVVATADDALGEALLDARYDARRDALSDSQARTADGAGSLDPADGKPPCCIGHNVRRESCAKTRAQRSEPFQSLPHA